MAVSAAHFALGEFVFEDSDAESSADDLADAVQFDASDVIELKDADVGVSAVNASCTESHDNHLA